MAGLQDVASRLRLDHQRHVVDHIVQHLRSLQLPTGYREDFQRAHLSLTVPGLLEYLLLVVLLDLDLFRLGSAKPPQL